MIEHFKFFRKETLCQILNPVLCFKPGFSPLQTNLNPPRNAQCPCQRFFAQCLKKRFAAEYAFFVNTFRLIQWLENEIGV